MPKKLSVFKKIEELRREYYQLLPGKEQLVQMINEAEIPEQVYNSNAIENSTLSLEDTEKILLQIDLDRYVSEREIFEAKNLARVMEYVHKHAPDKDLNEEMILFLHKILLVNIRDEIAGRFRRSGEYVRVGSHIAPAPEKIDAEIKKILLEYKSDSRNSITKKLARFHLRFENLHPFVDGNGRIGRVLNNYLLIREGYAPINIKFIEREKYYQAFKEFDFAQNTETMEEIVAFSLTNSYHRRLAYMKGVKIVDLKTYAKKVGISYNNAINKAKRQTIPAFMEKGKWKVAL